MRWQCRYCKQPAYQSTGLVVCNPCNRACDAPAVHRKAGKESAATWSCAFEPMAAEHPLEHLAAICSDLGITC